MNDAPQSAHGNVAQTDAPGLLTSPEFRAAVNQLLEQAFQSVLPSLVQRFQDEIDQRLGAGGGASSGGCSEIVNSEEMKELLDSRFRQMMLFLKQDVIPKAVEQKLAMA